VEAIDERDREVLLRLGYVIARAQLLELALLKLLEAQEHDLAAPLDERWPEVERWLTEWPAGRIANELQLSDGVAADLKEVVDRRNLVAHHAWRFYFTARERHGDPAVDAYCAWLDEQTAVFGRACRRRSF
jgi:hypothetical protein